MQKKKILFVIHQLNYGGVQKALLSALNAIDYSENEVTLYVRKNRVDLLDSVNSNVSKIIVNQDSTHYYRKPYAMCLEIGEKVSRLLKKDQCRETLHWKLVTYLNSAKMQYEKEHYFNDGEEYDVAISYIQGYTAQFVAEYVQAKKKIMFYHGSTDETHDLHERIMSHFDKIVGVNIGVQKVLQELYPRFAKKMTYIENYVDAEEVRRRSKEYQIPKSNAEITLCTCGRLTSVKGFDLAVGAAKILKDNGISFFWYFVGDGPERGKLESMINENGLEEWIEITGMLENPYPYIACCDIYVQSSYEEAHPLAIIEALLLECPVVTTTTVGGLALIKQEVSGLVTEFTGYAIAEAIKKLVVEREIYHKMKAYLMNENYSNDFLVYKEKWNQLLEVLDNEI